MPGLLGEACCLGGPQDATQLPSEAWGARAQPQGTSEGSVPCCLDASHSPMCSPGDYEVLAPAQSGEWPGKMC